MSKNKENSHKNSVNLAQNSAKNSTQDENKLQPLVIALAAFMAVILAKAFGVVIEFFGYDRAFLISELSIKDLMMFILIIAPFMACCISSGVLLAKLEKAILSRINDKYKIAFILVSTLAILLALQVKPHIVLSLAMGTLIFAVCEKHKQKSSKKCKFKPIKQGAYKAVNVVIVGLDYNDLDTPVHCVKHCVSIDEAVGFCKAHFGLKEGFEMRFDGEQYTINSGFDESLPSFVKAALNEWDVSVERLYIEQIIIKEGVTRYIIDDEFYRLERVDDLGEF